MKKLGIVFLVGIVTCAIGAAGLYFYKHPTLNTKDSSLTYKSVCVPIGDKYIDVFIDDDNELVSTNEQNIWRFTNTDIYLTSKDTQGFNYTETVKFKDNTVWKMFENQCVNITDTKNHMKWPADSLEIAKLEKYPQPDEPKELNGFPKYTVPENYSKTDEGIIYNVLDVDTELQKEGIISIYSKTDYYNAYIGYGNMDDIYNIELARLVNLSHETPSVRSVYRYAYAESGDRYFAIKQQNVNTFIVVNGRGTKYKDYAMTTVFGAE